MKKTEKQKIQLLPAVLDQELANYSYTLAKANEIKDQCLAIDVKDLTDRVGIALTTAKRKESKDLRLSVERRRKELNVEAYQRITNNNITGKTLREIFLEGELHLKNVELKVRKWRDEKREAKEAEKMQRLQTRIDQLAPYNVVPELLELKKMSDADFSKLLEKVKADFAAAEALKKQQTEQHFKDQKKLLEENEELKTKLNAVTTEAITSRQPVTPDPMLTGNVAATPEGNPDYAKYDNLLRDYVTAVRAVPVPDVSAMPIVEGILKQGIIFITKGLEYITKSIQD